MTMNKECIVDMKYNTFCWSDIDYSIIKGKAKDELNYYKTVYNFSVNQARENGDIAYLTQLQQGAFMERHEVREELYIMQELTLTAKKYNLGDVATKVAKEFDEYRMAFVDPSLRQQMQRQGGQPQ